MPITGQTVQCRVRWAVVGLAACAFAAAGAGAAIAADIDDARAMSARGRYEECLTRAAEAVSAGTFGEAWPLLKAEMEFTLGRYRDARETIEAALQKYPTSVRLRWRLRDAARFDGDDELAEAQLAEITRQVEATPWRYTDAENLIVLGEAALELGADAKAVQDAFFQRAKRNNPLQAAPQIALGRLALDKRDFALAADTFRTAAKTFGDNADVQYGLAAALVSSDPNAASEALNKALELNPHHVPSLLLTADRHIDGERYEEAEFALNRVLDVNPQHPEALAYWAAIGHLKSEPDLEQQLRAEALSTWKTNPRVDHLIGRKLSQKYRFQEGADHQRQALVFDPKFLPAKKQLAEDLLRLGEVEEGWRLADEAFRADEYDVAMYNLTTLRDELDKFRALEDESFIVRMERNEAAIYGARVLDLLNRAKATLCAKYGLELDGKVTVEIFHRPDDFAVRTFGMPGVVGYLGVCFGDVITANSPAFQQTNPSNWESVLWHEFAHVVTLNLTRNKMPRWLSEGISVYEERQANPAWGEQLTPQYREFILEGELTPIGRLSSAFLSPKSPLHVQFAYYESSLVVEYLVEQFGFEALTAILRDLGAGVFINDAIERHTAPLDELEEAFAKFAQDRADALAPDADWSKPDLEPFLLDADAADLLRQWAEANPKNVRGLTAYAQFLIQKEQWDDAKRVLRQLIELYPRATGGESPYVLLAGVHRKLNETDAERALLRQYVVLDTDATAAFLRLIELETARAEWAAVREDALRMLAVNPLVPQPHRALALAAEKTGNPKEAIAAYQSLLALKPDDLADAHYRLGKLLFEQGDATAARRHVLTALEHAPRFREAHALLLRIVRSGGSTPP
jgi:tetratricopeptide (TPR) repeat protein